MVEQHSQFIRNPSKMMDIVDYIIKSSAKQTIPEFDESKILQFNEIAKTIDRLKTAGAPVPDELRQLKIELSHVVHEYEKHRDQFGHTVSLLQEMELRLGNSLTGIRAVISRLTNSGSLKGKSKRYVKRTSPSALAKEIRKALRELGGSAKKSDVLQRVRLNMDGKFKPLDLERDAQGNLNWEKWAVAEKTKMTKEGIFKTGTGFGIWELRRK